MRTYYWAGFVVSGDISPIMSDASCEKYSIGVLILLSLFGLYYFKKRK